MSAFSFTDVVDSNSAEPIRVLARISVVKTEDGGKSVDPLSKPLPFNAYPFLVLTLFGWAWVHYQAGSKNAE